MDRKGIVELLWVLQSRYDANCSVKPHAHLHHHNLILIEKGSAEFEMEGSAFQMKTDDFLLIPPNARHGIRTVGKDGMNAVEIKFFTEDRVLKRMLRAVPARFTAHSFDRQLVQAILDAANSPISMLSIHASNSYLLSLLFYLSAPHSLANAIQDKPAMEEGGDGAFSQITQKTVEYLRNHFARDIALRDLADEIKYNKNYICSIFKKDTGKTINDYLTEIRVRKAEELLVFSHYTLSQIAQSTGFNSLSHFIRTFKKIMGLPPGMYKHTYPGEEMLSDLGNLSLSKKLIKSLTSEKLLRLERAAGEAAGEAEGAVDGGGKM